MSSKTSSTFKDAVRTFNKHVLNPLMLRAAGRKHWYAGVIRHVGRRSGRSYETPVVVIPVSDDGFAIPLPYGTGVDWLRNVLAAGTATVKVKGEICEVTGPEILDAADVAPRLASPRWRRMASRGKSHYLLVHRSHPDAPAQPHAATRPEEPEQGQS